MPVYLPGGDGNNSMISGNVQITGGKYDPSSRTLSLAIASGNAATTSMFSSGPRTAMSVDLIIQRSVDVVDTNVTFFPAMPTDDDYRPVWYDWNN